MVGVNLRTVGRAGDMDDGQRRLRFGHLPHRCSVGVAMGAQAATALYLSAAASMHRTLVSVAYGRAGGTVWR